MRRLAFRVLLAVALLGAAAVGVASAAGFHSPLTIGSECAAIGGFVFVDRRWLRAVDRWDRGAQGEEHVGAILDALAAQGWLALHDVSLGRGNVDHVLVGPGGLFSIETKSHAGRIKVAGIESRMLKQAYAQRKLLERITGMPVEALLVFSRAYLDRPVSRREGVLILPARMLAGHLRRRKDILTIDQVIALRARVLAALR